MQHLQRRPLASDVFWTGTAFFGMLVAAVLIAGALLRFPAPVVVGGLALLVGGPLVLWRPYLGLLGFLGLMYVHPEQWFPQVEAMRLPLLVACLTLAAWVLQVLRGGETFRWTPHLAWMLAFAGSMLLSQSVLGGGDLAATLLDAGRLTLLFLLIQQLLNTRERVQGAIHWHLLLTLAIAGLAIYGWWSGTGVLEDRGRLRALVLAGGFDDPNDLAAYLVLAVPVALLLATGGGSWLRRAGGTAAAAILTVALFLCDSRGGLLALAVAVAAFLFRQKGSVGQKWFGTAALGALIAVGTLGGLATGLREDDSAMGRVAAWEAGLQMFRDHPLAGVGYEGFRDHHPILAHNSFVQVLAEGGFLGALGWVGLNYWAVLTLFRVSRSDTDEPLGGYAAALLAGLLASLAASMFLSHTYRPIPLIPVAMAAALGMMLPRKGGGANWPHYLAVPVITLVGVALIYGVVRILG